VNAEQRLYDQRPTIQATIDDVWRYIVANLPVKVLFLTLATTFLTHGPTILLVE
jgi:hypothetical protein